MSAAIGAFVAGTNAFTKLVPAFETHRFPLASKASPIGLFMPVRMVSAAIGVFVPAAYAVTLLML